MPDDLSENIVREFKDGNTTIFEFLIHRVLSRYSFVRSILSGWHAKLDGRQQGRDGTRPGIKEASQVQQGMAGLQTRVNHCLCMGLTN